MVDQEQWLKDHKGKYLSTSGYVWFCEDDDCGCTQALVIEYYENKVDSRWRVPVGVWEGTFFTDHEGGADLELANYRRELKASDPEKEASITWQKGVDYDEGG